MLKNVIHEDEYKAGWILKDSHFCVRGRDGGLGVGHGGRYFICLQYSGGQCKKGLMYSAWGRR